jgi:predicted nucleic acid-binding protein
LTVIDASIAVDALAERIDRQRIVLEALTTRVQAPQIFAAEVTAGIRGLLLGGHISDRVAARARQRLAVLMLDLQPFAPYAERIWDLRHNLTVYDAWYVAIAERLDQPLVTADAAILGAPGLRCGLIDAR